MAIRKELLEELLKDYKGPEDLTGENGILKQLTKALVEQAMGAVFCKHEVPKVAKKIPQPRVGKKLLPHE